MAVNVNLTRSVASMKLQVGEKLTKSVSIPGLVPNIDASKVFAVAKAINACQGHTMQQLNVTQTTVVTEE